MSCPNPGSPPAFPHREPQPSGMTTKEIGMGHPSEHDYQQIPGLFRLWDLQFLFSRDDDYHVHYAEQTGDGTPLFAVYRRAVDEGRAR